jgi:type II secretory pathway pseudopilin PulG
MTLLEVLISLAVLSICLGGILSTLGQSRRLTEASIFQNSTVTILQGYIEQMKNMEYDQVTVSPASGASTLTIPTLLDEATPDPLTVSSGTPPSTLPAIGTTPTGAVNNSRVIDINNTPSNPNDDLNLNLWIWVNDLTGTATNVQRAKSITIIYTWQFRDGNRIRSYRDTVRTIRSVVPSF